MSNNKINQIVNFTSVIVNMGSPVAMQVKVNNVKTVAYVQFTGTFLHTSQSRSQGNDLHLVKGDRVVLHLTSGCYYSGAKQTAFFGMMLTPDA